MINNKNSNSNVNIIYKLLVTARALEKAGDEIFSRYGITQSMYEILMLIGHGTDTTTELASISQITLASITHKTKLMEDKGYIKRTVGKKDKRVWYFSLTTKGRRLLETIHSVYEEMTVPLFAQFSVPYKEQVSAFLTSTEQHLRHVLNHRQIMLEYISKTIEQKGIVVE
jgi:DNA-binding MarR family transcriptional regulator